MTSSSRSRRSTAGPATLPSCCFSRSSSSSATSSTACQGKEGRGQPVGGRDAGVVDSLAAAGPQLRRHSRRSPGTARAIRIRRGGANWAATGWARRRAAAEAPGASRPGSGRHVRHGAQAVSSATAAPRRAREDTAWLGMLIFPRQLGDDVRLAVLRLRRPAFSAAGWPPPGTPQLPRFLPAFNTVVLGPQRPGTAARLGSARRAAQKKTAAIRCVGLLVLGLVFLGLQWSSGRTSSVGPGARGRLPGSSGVRADRVSRAARAGRPAWPRPLVPAVSSGTLNAARNNRLRLWVMYWHFVGVVWLTMYLLIFVV